MEYTKIPPIESMKNAFDVKGYNVVVTGGNRGMGYGIALAFAQSGANLAIVCRNAKSGAEAVEKLSAYGTKVACFTADVSDFDQVKAASDQIFEFFDHVDVLINNSGVDSPAHFLDEDGLSEWHRVMDINLHGPANMVYCIAPKMRDAGLGGSIINISSVGAFRVHSAKELAGASYNASKAGLDIFTRHMAIILGDYGIRVNGINPGPNLTDLSDNLPEGFTSMVDNELPAHRFGKPIEVGAFCVFLASPAASQIRGINCPHDGGLMLIQ
ncbi:MAG: SDR family oxidoreductase [Clostridiales Family XIII bacterium]|nr:SDR family oxidoreductase [Clostridiales Family XIII bacterium]